MNTRFYRNSSGGYLGGYGQGVTVPDEAIEVPAAPANAAAVWNGAGWTEPPPPRALVPLAVVLTRVIALRALPPLLAVLQAAPEAAQLLLTLREGIFADDTQARQVLVAAGLNPDQVLAP
jgi:hypothetical protein